MKKLAIAGVLLASLTALAACDGESVEAAQEQRITCIESTAYGDIVQMEKEGRKRIMTKYKWLETKYRIGIFIVTKHLCSNCAMSIDMVDYPDGLPNKCPNCGARMDLQPLKWEVEE